MRTKTNRNQIIVHEDYSKNIEIIVAMLPLLAMAIFLYGPRPALMVCISTVTALICDKIVSMLRGYTYNKTDNGSVVIAIMLTMLLPATLDYYIIIIGVVIAVLLGKHAFGGTGNYPFNPTALGYSVVLVGWTEKMLSPPLPFTEIPLFGEFLYSAGFSPTKSLSLGGLPNVDVTSVVLGDYAGAIGCTSALILLSCFAFLLIRKRISFLVPASFLLSATLFVLAFPRVQEVSRLEVAGYEIFSGTILFSAVFILSDATTLPKNKYSKIVYGLAIGVTTMLFRYFGAFEIGVCFSILSINSIFGYLDRLVAKISTKLTSKKIKQKKPLINNKTEI